MRLRIAFNRVANFRKVMRGACALRKSDRRTDSSRGELREGAKACLCASRAALDSQESSEFEAAKGGTVRTELEQTLPPTFFRELRFPVSGE